MMEVTCLLERVMERKGVKRSQLAQLLGRTKGWVTQLLDDEGNHTLRTLADVFAVLDHSLHFSVGSLAVDEVYNPDLGSVWPTEHGQAIGELDLKTAPQVTPEVTTWTNFATEPVVSMVAP